MSDSPSPPLASLSPRRRSRISAASLLGLVVIAVVALGGRGPRTAFAQAPPGEYIPEDDPNAAQDVPVDPNGDEYADTDPSALTDFRSTLDPHGSWVDDPTYGQLWVPNSDEVGPSFAPYVSEGSWAYEQDYVWVSNYEWGWVPFHYGRWAWTSGRWGWIPGRTYAGAWVSWRTGPEGYGYVGWGPLAPSFGWQGGVAYGLGASVIARPAPVVFVSRESLFAPRVAAHVVVGDRMASIAGETRPYGRIEPLGRPTAIARSGMRGPPPSLLGIPPSAVVRADLLSPSSGIARARAYSRPSSAQAFGARPPIAHTVRLRRWSGGGAAPGAGAVRGERAPVERQQERAPAAPPMHPGGAVRGGGGGGRRH